MKRKPDDTGNSIAEITAATKSKPRRDAPHTICSRQIVRLDDGRLQRSIRSGVDGGQLRAAGRGAVDAGHNNCSAHSRDEHEPWARHYRVKSLGQK